MQSAERLRPYVPSFVVQWLRDEPAVRHRQIDGTLAFVDISGFTRLTERLAARGKVGAEEMTGILDRTFGELLGVAYSYGAWLVKWGGDAVLLLFQGDDHATRAATAAIGMRRAMDDVGRVRTPSGAVRLRVSTGLHSGAFDFFLVGSSHRELVITGPGPSTTAAMEAAASAGQVAVSPETAALLPPGVVRPRPDGVLLITRSPGAVPDAVLRSSDTTGVDLGQCLPAVTREHLLAGDDDAEHRLVSVAFVEFSGVDALLAEQGPGATTAAVDAVIRTCQDAAVRHGVTFWETDISKDGGKVMLVAGVPSSSGSEEDAMLAVARDVVDAGGVLSVRVGVNSGRVFFGQFGPPYRRTMSIKGDAVNLAARLMGKAAYGEVLAAVQVVATARTPFAVEPLPPFLVKGKTQLIHACRVGPVREQGHVGVDDDGPFVGRTAELAKLRAHWRLAHAGRLQVCELVGEPGVGKSRLVRELLTSVDGRTLEMRADQYTAASAYTPFRRLVRDVLGVAVDATPQQVGDALLSAMPPDLRPFAPLVAAVVDAEVAATPESDAVDDRFRAQRQEEVAVDLLATLLPEPTVLFLDDAHLLDASSTSLLRRLAGRAADSPWLLLVCRREDTEARPLEGVDGVASTALNALDPSASLELVHALTEASPLPPHEAAQLLRRAGGNPLFLAELAAATASGARVEDLPHSVEHVVAARIDALDRADRALLRAAAVIGMAVWRSTLEALGQHAGFEVTSAALERLSAFLAPTEEGTLRFRQALVQETAYEGLPYSRRKVLHGHVGDVLSAVTGPEADAVLSLHFLRAERYPEAWQRARAAAARAAAAHAHVETAELFSRAVTAARALDAGEELAQAWEGLGDARFRLAQFPLAADAYARARRLTDAVLEVARLRHKSALCAERSGSYVQALRWSSGARSLLGSGPADSEALRLAAQTLVVRATVRHWQGRHRDAVRECRAALALADACNALDVRAETLVWLDVSELMLGRGDGTDAREAETILRHLGDRPWQLGRCLNELGIRAWYAGDWDAARRFYEDCRASFTDAGDAWAAALAQANEAEILVDQGRLAEAEPLLRAALRAGRASAAPGHTAFVLSLLGRLEAGATRVHDALSHLAEAHRLYNEIGEPDAALDTQLRIAEARALAGDAAGALDDLAALPAAAPTPLLLRVRGLSLALNGDVIAARKALDESLSLGRSRGSDHDVVLALAALLWLHERGGDAFTAGLREEHAALCSHLGIVTIALPPRAVPRVPAPREADERIQAIP